MYMNSNESYQKVNPDSAVNGMAIGAAATAASAGFVHAGVSLGAKRQMRKFRNQSVQLRNNSMSDTARNDARAQLRDNFNNSPSVRTYNKSFGSGWRKALTYGVGAAVGGAIGGMTDTMVDS
ncbi:hypothetical protein [Virgibacillus salexigens]|uniref:Uncharacterized protein n=1 Tax=Virgibacillus massiliensis TaxID=1462526 RepID=A0A024QHV7_9BACI|nr:hypothetical protein [Virgibacillus massiliensis]CDQ41832.1 hypothetical protein BN990_04209 [Virgibacillus massiliensis]